MHSRRKTDIDNYLYEIIDCYKDSSSDEEKRDIFKSFCSSIWSSDNKRRIYTKTIRFTVRKDLLKTEIGQIFDMWSEIEYKGYKSMSKETDWCSLTRQKINNLYTRYFDKEIILKRDYMNLLNTPKRLYYEWIDGMETDPAELTSIIDGAMDDAGKLKITYQKQKMELSWNEYKKVIEGFLQNIFNNCMLIEDYEKGSNYLNIYDFMDEDNFYTSYFCKSLEYEMLNWQKKYYGLKRGRSIKYKRCQSCGALIENTGNRKTYCNTCSHEREKERKRITACKYQIAK